MTPMPLAHSSASPRTDTTPGLYGSRDLADLDLLDDETRHAYCPACYPNKALGVPFIAICGRKAIGFVGHSPTPPPNACPQCIDLYLDPCPTCGQ